MSSAYLESYIANSTHYLKTLIPTMTKKGLDRQNIQKLCGSFRQRGACTFFDTGTSQAFWINLMQSAGAYLEYLKHEKEEQKVTSLGNGFYDAIGIGFWECARDIARESRMTWNPSYEYEDDFLFVQFLMKHFFLDAEDQECQQIIDQHQIVAEGKDQLHRDFCLSFLKGDQGLFEKSIHLFLKQRRDKIEEMVEEERIPEEDWSWLRYFSGTGLALIKLAEQKGFQTGRDYLHIPEALRRIHNFPFDFEAWKKLHYTPAKV